MFFVVTHFTVHLCSTKFCKSLFFIDLYIHLSLLFVLCCAVFLLHEVVAK